jgi:hypothetical protein
MFIPSDLVIDSRQTLTETEKLRNDFNIIKTSLVTISFVNIE